MGTPEKAGLRFPFFMLTLFLINVIDVGKGEFISCANLPRPLKNQMDGTDLQVLKLELRMRICEQVPLKLLQNC